MTAEEWHKPDTRVRMPDGTICKCPDCGSHDLVPTGRRLGPMEREKEVECRACGTRF